MVKKVKNLPPSSLKWYSGTELVSYVTGSYGNVAEWQIDFSNESYNEFLFASGDFSIWLIAAKDQVIDVTSGARTIVSSSLN
jgi:hypothetical protein